MRQITYVQPAKIERPLLEQDYVDDEPSYTVLSPIVFKKCLPSVGDDFKAANNDQWLSPDMMGHTNCYAYALNHPDMGFAFVGQMADPAGIPASRSLLTQDGFKKLIEHDGLKQIDEDIALTGKSHVVAAFLFENQGYHFVRKDGPDEWSHKYPWKTPSTVDDRGVKITNPREAKLGYYNFVGFFEVPASGIQYLPRLDLDAV